MKRFKQSPLTNGACLTLAALALAAGCSSPHGASVVPSGAAPFDAAGLIPASTSLNVTIVKDKTPAGVPAAASIGLALGSAHPTIVHFEDKAPCKSSGGGTLTCTATLKSNGGFKWLTVTTYAQSVKGKPAATISTGRIGIDFGAGSSVKLGVYALAASIDVTAMNGAIDGNKAGGFTIGAAAPNAAPFAIDSLDSAGRHVVGPGAPTFTFSTSNHAYALATPKPNELTIEPPASADGTKSTIHVTLKGKHASSCAHGCTLAFDVSKAGTPTPSPSPSPTPTKSPSPSPSPSGSPGPTPTPTGSPMVFVSFATSGSAGTVRAFNLQGNPVSTSGWGNTGLPKTLAYVPASRSLYVLTSGTSPQIQAYSLTGATQPLNPGFGGVNASAFVYDPHNGLFYVANGTSVNTYDVNGNLKQSGVFSTTVATPPNGMTFDSQNDNIYVADGSTIDQFNEAGTPQATGSWTGACNMCVPTALVYDPPALNWIYVASTNGGTGSAVACYTYGGNSCESPISSGVSLPTAITYSQTTNGNLYVANNGAKVTVYTYMGMAVSITGNFTPPGITPTAINGILVVDP